MIGLLIFLILLVFEIYNVLIYSSEKFFELFYSDDKTESYQLLCSYLE